MRCVVCDSTNWENVDKYRYKQFKDAARTKPLGMSICLECGFVSYPELYKDESEMINFYKTQYREKPPEARNYFTSERKLGYHEAFLKDPINKWINENRKDLTIVDVGCGIGLLPCWLKNMFHDSDVYGTELSRSYRRVAWHSFGVETHEEIKDKPHDLIALYQVAEHQYDVDLKFKKYHSLLKDDGLFYVSVPIWFNNMENFGTAGFDLEYYYDTAHFNVWTEPHFESLLSKAGFKIEKKDVMMYGNTYICSKSKEPLSFDKSQFPKVEQIKDKMSRIKEAARHLELREFKEALDKYPAFPMAWKAMFEQNREKLYQEGFEAVEAFWKHALESTYGDLELGQDWADVLMRFDKFDRAIEVLSNIRAFKPRHPFTFLAEAQCYRELAKRTSDEKKKYHYFTKSRELMDSLRSLSTQNVADALNWSYADSSQIPTPMEGLQ